MNIITDTNIITYFCTGLLIVGGFFFIGLLVRRGKRPDKAYYEFPITGQNYSQMYDGDEE